MLIPRHQNCISTNLSLRTSLFCVLHYSTALASSSPWPTTPLSKCFPLRGNGTGLLAVCHNVCCLFRKHWALGPGCFSRNRSYCMCSYYLSPCKQRPMGCVIKEPTQMCWGSPFYCPMSNESHLSPTPESDIFCQQIWSDYRLTCHTANRVKADPSHSLIHLSMGTLPTMIPTPTSRYHSRLVAGMCWLEHGIWGHLSLFPGCSHSYLAQEHTVSCSL